MEIKKILSAALQFSKDMVAARKKQIAIVDYKKEQADLTKIRETGMLLGLKTTINKIKSYAKDNQHSTIK